MTSLLISRNLRFKVAAACVILLSLSAMVFAQAGDTEMSAGFEEYKCGNYERAIKHLNQALQLDPELVKAHLYLANSYAALYVPGSDSAENLLLAEKSTAEFKRVLAGNPSPELHAEAVRSLASLNFAMKNFDLASEFYQELLKIDPDDARAYYSLGVVDWMEAYKPDQELRASMGLKPTDEMPSGSGCTELRSLNEEKIEDGIRRLQRALEIRCDYDDAMAYMNLLYRQKAEYECDDQPGRQADLKLADEWVDRTMATKKAKAEKIQVPGCPAQSSKQSEKR